MNPRWVPHDTRDRVVDFVTTSAEKTEIPVARFVSRLGISTSKFYDWRQRYGKANEHNGKIPRDHWLEEWEKEAILDFQRQFPLEGYRRLTFMMLDRDVVAVSPTTTWRVLSAAGVFRRWSSKTTKKGTGFAQPSAPHEHWHIHISYVNLRGTFYYLCSILDGYSRFIVHWDLRESMTEAEVELTVQRARERFPDASPRIISDNGPQFIARDFKEFIRLCGMTHVRTSPYYPQSNGKLERWHRSFKSECIRVRTPTDFTDAKELVGEYVSYYNNVRLHSAIGYVAPEDKLAGREQEIFAARDRKLEAARRERQRRRAAQRVTKQEEPRPKPAVATFETHSAAASQTATADRDGRRVDALLLRRLRNDLPILSVIEHLGIPTARRGNRLSFRCPQCHAPHARINERVNLGRCFRCARNYNTLGLVITECRVSFLEAVERLAGLLGA